MSRFIRRRAYLNYALIAAATIILTIFLVSTHHSVAEMEAQEKERISIWADATQRLANTADPADAEFLLNVISRNNSIPVLIADSTLNILDVRNFNLPDTSSYLSAANTSFLRERVRKAGWPDIGSSDHFMTVNADNGSHLFIYYEDSPALRRMSVYPYILASIGLILSIVLYVAFAYTRRAEQDRLWGVLSRETAHQLGTPISSLLAWQELLASDKKIDRALVSELGKDINALAHIADRFSKIGSTPELQPCDVGKAVEETANYMRPRLSRRTQLVYNAPATECRGMLCPPVFAWVIENLIKNAADAIAGEGFITISFEKTGNHIVIYVADTGCGIPRSVLKHIFTPGYTTKKRGRGLGLALAKRIVEQYHGGRLRVAKSTPHSGTIFAIELPFITT